ncbi:carbohydrate ABC transporter permease [Jeotgalibacillus soli]|uniref:ABC transmembrane type-1 domain-containing protein n=1 Tax=Jeotgalibacillus soli TaxID=889306 RepID=A0A0C2VZQ7_9BACL|nr:sugar ABC transporter permease [Jeotgalibacillus soli]KIL49423.1 hypothetical protein KP78_08910 [Jeotgalibacillus soli]
MKKRMGPYLVTAPALVFLALMALYPLIFLLKISFQDYSPINFENPYVGFDNYATLLADSSFWNSIKVTAIFVVSAVSIELVLGLALALILNQKIKAGKMFQTLIMLPIFMAPTVVGLMFRFMMNEQYGVINYFAEVLGFDRTAWLSDPTLALPALIITDIWQWTPFMIIILLAGLQGISDEPLEAAQIDGATKWQALRYVTIPMLSQVIIIAVLLRTIDAFRLYDSIFMMTQGGPVNVTSTLSWIVFDKGFRFLDFGYGAAIAVVMLIIVLILLTLFLKRFSLFEESGEK